MKLKSDGYSFFLISKILEHYVEETIKSVDFFPGGISFLTGKGTIDVFLLPRFCWCSFDSSAELKKEKAFGWLQALKNGTIISSRQVGKDRLLCLEVSTDGGFGGTKKWNVWFEFFGGFPNAFLTKGDDGRIVRHFRKSLSERRKLRVGDVYEPPFPDEIQPRNFKEWMSASAILMKMDQKTRDILEKAKILDSSQLSMITYEDGFYAIPCIKSGDFAVSSPLKIIEEITDTSSEVQGKIRSEKNFDKHKKAEKAALKLLESIVPPESILLFGEKIKSSDEKELGSIFPEDKRLKEIYRKFSGRNKGEIIENLFTLYRKNLKRKAAVEKKLSEIREQMEKKTDALNSEEVREKSKVKSADPLSKYRTFTTPTGKLVAVSKSAEDADRLTMKIACQKDMFFHVKDAKGSHVILFLEGTKDAHKNDIEFAASIAAGFSSARFSSLVPVQYTLKKYVRKPRKSPKGLVVLDREKIVFVRPLSEKPDSSS